MKALGIGCGIVVLLVLLGVLGLVGYGVYLAQDPPGMVVTLSAPATVEAGEEFTLAVEVLNERGTEPLEVTTIDVADEFLGDFVLVETVPETTASSHDEFSGYTYFTFEQAIPQGQTVTFEFRLRAPSEAGIHRGDVDVCEGMRFITNLAQVEVVESG